MNRYEVHLLKTHNLSADERRAVRKNARGLWVFLDTTHALTGRAACAAIRLKNGDQGKLRSKLIA